MNNVASTLFFSTANVALASGTEAAASTLVGPGLAGLIVITPSIPDPPAEGLCPVEVQIAMTMSPKAVGNLRNLTAHYPPGVAMVNHSKQKANPNRLALDEGIVASKFSASIAHETLPAVCNCGWCGISHFWERRDALSHQA
jgi:hypothetical protein